MAYEWDGDGCLMSFVMVKDVSFEMVLDVSFGRNDD
jgi:hypothetical protein